MAETNNEEQLQEGEHPPVTLIFEGQPGYDNEPPEITPAAINTVAKEYLKSKGRVNKTVGIYTAEFSALDKIVQARINSELTYDYNHFIRQCIDFAINHNRILTDKGYTPGKDGYLSFSVPANIDCILKDAFVNPKIKD